MQEKFSWSLPLTEDGINHLLNEACITFDANVILDMYRVDSEGRQEIKLAVEQFKEQIWLTHQVASEIVKNKNIVSSKSQNIFQKYAKQLKEVQTNLGNDMVVFEKNNHTINKIIPEKIAEYLASLEELTEKFYNELIETGKVYSAELRKENILGWVFETFNKKVGEPFTEEEQQKAKAESTQRIKEKIPPGYMDKKNKPENPHGDYFLWKQILSKIEKEKKKIVLVTSEKKEDWFEIISGKTLSPRQELLREAHMAGGKVLILKTEKFLERAARLRSKGNLPEKTKNTIEQIQQLRTTNDKKVIVLKQIISPNSTEAHQEGDIVISLNEPLYYFTVSGKLSPHTVAPPRIEAFFVACPFECPQKIHFTYGAGTLFDFNIHCRSLEYGIKFPEGIYEIHYRVESLPNETATIDLSSDNDMVD